MAVIETTKTIIDHAQAFIEPNGTINVDFIRRTKDEVIASVEFTSCTSWKTFEKQGCTVKEVAIVYEKYIEPVEYISRETF